ncbi:MAG: hypothetical protein MUC38_06915 [Cyclobacteriaceae bacterium]|nr:hypothetical protein [Cyclobacteriaceae bacterium]
MAGNVAWAQEENTELPLPAHPTEERVERIEPPVEDGFPVQELDGKSVRNTAPAKEEKKDSERAGTKKLGDKATARKNDDDALSFNFLYYLIQKFKVSDLIEN